MSQEGLVSWHDALVPPKKRLSEAETTQRVLDAATRLVQRDGLVLDLRLRMEEVIEHAGVARAAVYRRWPSRDALAVDVLRHVATVVEPPTVGPEVLADVVTRAARRRSDRGDRVALAGSMLGEAAAVEVELLFSSPEWRTYLLLVAAVDALPDAGTREVIAEVLVDSEARRRERLIAAYRLLAEELALQVVGSAGLDTLVRTAASLIRGSVTQAWRVAPREGAARAAADVRAAMPALVSIHLAPDPDRDLPADWAASLRTKVRSLAQ